MAKITLLSSAHIHSRGFLQSLVSSFDGRSVRRLWDDDVERGSKLAAEFGIPFEPDLAAALEDPEADGFAICSETSRHLPLLEAALPKGKPIFCDKPLVTGAKELKKLRKLLSTANAPIVTGYFLPHFGDHRAVVNLLKGSFFGTVTRVRFRNAHNAAYAHWFDAPGLGWFADPKLAGGGGFLDMGTHSVHLLRSLFGPVTEVCATIGNESGVYPATDDYGVALLRFESGMTGVAEGGWTQTGGPRQLEIVGSEKTLWHDGREYRVEGPNFPQEPLYTIDSAPTRMDRLVAAVRGQIPAETLAEELVLALDAVAIMEACYKSADKGKWVKVG